MLTCLSTPRSKEYSCIQQKFYYLLFPFMMTEHLVFFYQWLTSWMTTLSYDIVHYAWQYLWLCGQILFQEQLYNSALPSCSECYTLLIPLHLSHVTWGWVQRLATQFCMFLEPCLHINALTILYSHNHILHIPPPISYIPQFGTLLLPPYPAVNILVLLLIAQDQGEGRDG